MTGKDRDPFCSKRTSSHGHKCGSFDPREGRPNATWQAMAGQRLLIANRAETKQRRCRNAQQRAKRAFHSQTDENSEINSSNPDHPTSGHIPTSQDSEQRTHSPRGPVRIPRSNQPIRAHHVHAPVATRNWPHAQRPLTRT